jgi:nucleotide-binding universal stress UspA family protein
MDLIVVGVDGSEASGVALEFAVEEAVRRKGGLRIVCTWELPAVAAPPEVFAPPLVGGHAEYAERAVSEAVARAKELQPQIQCTGVVVPGYASDVLVEEGRAAALLVVGRRGHGGLAGLLLGSVSRRVADHAPCPVTIVPPLVGV